jgi:bacterioferritin (cytochrome b1)
MQKQSIDDNYYNIAKQLVKKLEFLSHAKGYVNDAKNCNTGLEEVWTKIIADEEKHVEMLQTQLAIVVRRNNPDPY